MGISDEKIQRINELARRSKAEGLTEEGFRQKFGRPLPAVYRQRAAALPTQLVEADGSGIRLTRLGFLLSNALIARLIG